MNTFSHKPVLRYIRLHFLSQRPDPGTELQTWCSPVTNISTLFTETKTKNTKERKTENIGNIYSMNTISWWCSCFLATCFSPLPVCGVETIKASKPHSIYFMTETAKTHKWKNSRPRHVTRCCHKTSAWRRKHLYTITFLKPLSHHTCPHQVHSDLRWVQLRWADWWRWFRGRGPAYLS